MVTFPKTPGIPEILVVGSGFPDSVNLPTGMSGKPGNYGKVLQP
jgi:hypothetical protein